MALTTGSFLTDSGSPSDLNGSDGDHYRNTANQDLWFKVGGSWTLVGNVNDETPDGIGTIWLSGSGVPFSGNGANGNYYRDTENQNVWVKVGGFWTLIGVLFPVAIGGTTILDSAGLPDSGVGLDGNYYRDTETQNIYFKTNGIWSLVGRWAQDRPE